ncbi:hypothetical protein THAOC_35389 [Thalassiosira oceanica]|uniref:Uncharacterized protein n=1 Tax=Thalassiosira oceanica TaxID=159749 RepID=K0RAA9_THAOC|nr:hypothetical protein THAOC_35389 [Thalassiosira oceanica]|eukprot:EJK45966.1 hypothetical protein THAOC_35389 [Thalassiosira oceanica]
MILIRLHSIDPTALCQSGVGGSIESAIRFGPFFTPLSLTQKCPNSIFFRKDAAQVSYPYINPKSSGRLNGAFGLSAWYGSALAIGSIGRSLCCVNNKSEVEIPEHFLLWAAFVQEDSIGAGRSRQGRRTVKTRATATAGGMELAVLAVETPPVPTPRLPVLEHQPPVCPRQWASATAREPVHASCFRSPGRRPPESGPACVATVTAIHLSVRRGLRNAGIG